MNTMKSVLNALLVWAVVMFGVTAASAQKLPSASIAVIDIQKILRDSLAAKSVRPQAKKMRTGFQNDVRRQQEELRKAEQALAQQRSILSPESYAKKRRDFETRARQAQRQVQARKRQLEGAFNTAMEKVRRSLIIVAQELAKERKVNIVLPKSVVLLSITGLDITDQALKRLNKRLPSVKVVIRKKK
jgi:outer membrane protein